MDANERAGLIDRYRGGAAAVVAALDGITPEELDAPEPGGGWTPRQVVLHLADSETQSTSRIRRLLMDNAPIIQGYDQDLYASGLFPDRDITRSLALFVAVRDATAEIIARMTDADWTKTGTHTDSGTYTAEDWLRIYAAHAHDHADQIRRGRQAAHAGA